MSRNYRGPHTVDSDPRWDKRLAEMMKGSPGLYLGADEENPTSAGPFQNWEEKIAAGKKKAQDAKEAKAKGIKRPPEEKKDYQKVHTPYKMPKQPAEVRAMWGKEGLETETRTFTSQPDGNECEVVITRPAGTKGQALPCAVHLHGGGMAFGGVFDPGFAAWCRMLAHQGIMTVQVEFRNCEAPASKKSSIAPFPAGLNDCYAGLKWTFDNAASIGADSKRIIVTGESGGGNLTIATVLKAKKEGTLNMISGFYAMCPYIAGSWPQDVKNEGILGTSHLPEENNGYSLILGGTKEMSNAAAGYGPEAFRKKDPMAWPGFATVDDLKGLPRAVISVNECDPLRDEGLNFYRLLQKAGVPSVGRTVLGTNHGGDETMSVVPDISLETAQSIAAFAKGNATSKL